MSLFIHLLGRPRILGGGSDEYAFRSRKSWATFAYLLLTERPPSRTQLASMLFAEADDPARALRWCLTEIRRALGDDGSVDGDPVVLTLADDAVVDINVVAKGGWRQAIDLPGLGAELLEGVAVKGAASFDTWLLSQQRHVAAAAEAILHEAALGSMAHGDIDHAIGYAVRAAAMSPLDENHQSLLIRLYRTAGDDDAARRQFDAVVATFRTELGVGPGPAVMTAMRESVYGPDEIADGPTVQAIVEAGSAAVAAGAVESGVQSLRTAVRLADRTRDARLRVSARLRLGETLIHSIGGLDEVGLAALFEADQIATAHGDAEGMSCARAELGYVDFLRGRYDRAEVWLNDALAVPDVSDSLRAKAMTYLGTVASDRADYPEATALLDEAIALSRTAGEPRREAWAMSMLGRISLFHGALDVAGVQLDASITLAERDHWLAFLPWPQALRGEVQLAQGDPAGASALLQQAFARACQIGDPCWEGMSARGLALTAEAGGDTDRAFSILTDAGRRARRLADPYVWLDGYILDAQCDLGRRYHHPDVASWVESLRALASRTGMKEFAHRSLVHGAALGNEADAALLAA